MKKLFFFKLFAAVFAVLLNLSAKAWQVPVIDTIQPLQTEKVYEYDTSNPLTENSVFIIKNRGMVALGFCITPQNVNGCPLASYLVQPGGMAMITAADLGQPTITPGVTYELRVSNTNLAAGIYIITPLLNMDRAISHANPSDSLRAVFVDSSGNLKTVPGVIVLCPGLDPYWQTDGNNVPTGCTPYIGTRNSRELIFKTNANGVGGGERMRISAIGNVGIGCSNPAYALDVNGAIRGKEVRVELTGCDFVFEKDYNLTSLKDRKVMVLFQKHLPNIAPAFAMQKGQDLGALSLGLLQNVEEHENYLYQHDDRIEKLEKENLLLKQELETLREEFKKITNR